MVSKQFSREGPVDDYEAGPLQSLTHPLLPNPPYTSNYLSLTQDLLRSQKSNQCSKLILLISKSGWLSPPIKSAKCLQLKLLSLCNSVYVGETCLHFSTCVREHETNDKNSQSCKHLKSSNVSKNISNENCFTITDSSQSSYQHRIKEVLHPSSIYSFPMPT